MKSGLPVALLCLFLAAALAACGGQTKSPAAATPAPSTGEVPTKITVGFAPSSDAAKISTKMEPLQKFLENELGIPVETFVPTDYIGLAEAMGSKKVDVGFLNTAAYALANREFGVKVLLKSVRNDAQGKPQTTYNAQIIVHKDSGIKSVADLQGKKMAFTDPASTSGYIYPLNYLLNNAGVKDPSTFFAKTGFLIGHDNVAKAVYNKDFDAGACFDDCRTRIQTENPDVMDKVVIIQKIEGIPNDTVSVRKELSPEFAQKVRNALLKFAQDPEGKKAMYALYQWDGVTDAKHQDYKAVFDVIEATKLNLREAMKKK